MNETLELSRDFSMTLSKKDLRPSIRLPDRCTMVIPPSPFLQAGRYFMTLGLLKIVAMLKLMGIRVDVIDLSGVRNPIKVIHDYVSQNPDVHWYGITATSPQMPYASRISAKIKSLQPDAETILGGPHITVVNAAYQNEIKINAKRVTESLPPIENGRGRAAFEKAQELFSVLVAGDGELAIFEVFDESRPRFVNADIPSDPLFLNNRNLTLLPFPARDMVDVSSYMQYKIDGVTALSLIAQLGCPFNCGFCSGRGSPMLRNIRMRTSENVVAEMEYLYLKYGICAFMMYDDELNVNPKMLELMHLIAAKQKQLGVKWVLRGFIKSQLFNDAQAEAMYEAGFRVILVGFESGSEVILQAINKKATKEQNTRCVEIAHRHGLKVKALMSIGHPGETWETIQETIDWLLFVKPFDFDATIITCYPGTPYYDLAVPTDRPGIWVYRSPLTGGLLYQIDTDFTKKSAFYKGDPKNYTALVYTETLSPKDLVRGRNRVERMVRGKLHIPYNKRDPGIRYEHSMGQNGRRIKIPSNILRSSWENN